MANQENIKKWVDALESGEYEQTVGALHNGVGYCCLGVACEVAIKNGLFVSVEEADTDSEDIRYDGYKAYLPESVSGWLGLEEAPFVLVGGKETSLVDLNDGRLWTFDQIARVIKETYLKDVDVSNIPGPMDD